MAKLEAWQNAEKALMNNEDKANEKSLINAVTAAKDDYDAALLEAEQARDKLMAMEAKREKRWAEEMAAEEKKMKEDYDTRRKVMDDAKKLYDEAKAEREDLDTKMADIDALITAAEGGAKEKLKK